MKEKLDYREIYKKRIICILKQNDKKCVSYKTLYAKCKGKKPRPDYDLADWVLGRFSDEDKQKLQTVFDNAVSAAELIVKGEISEAMNRYNK